MSDQSQVLYRKYRPQSFSQVFGQDHIVKVLKGSLELKKIGHAYLFSGPRGTGKTTMARLFAKELNCSETDIIEIDAASNRGIDDIRQLREGVHSLPFSSEYKMYIIDEVHMLTKEAFNALLKTLEEPPSHVIFVLATTELHKVLPTVISRCQSFVFKSPTQTILKEMIQGIVDKEGSTIDSGSLDLIALLGNGSFRDTQGVLQKLMSYSKDKHITREETEMVTGAPSVSLITDMLDAVSKKDSAEVLNVLHATEEQNIDPYIFIQMLVQSIRHILFIRFSPQQKAHLKQQLEEELFETYEVLASQKNTINSGLLTALLHSYQNMHVSFSKYFALELALIEFLQD